MKIPVVTEHPLKEKVRRSGLRLWQVKRMLGGFPSESEISRMLNGIVPMSDRVETGLQTILAELKKPLVQVK